MKKVRLILSIFTIGFLLNLIWENVQAPLYQGYNNFWNHFMLCFWASLVDAAVVLLLYGFLAIWYKNFYWLRYINRQSAAVLMVLGATIAVGFEQWAFGNEAWSYTDDMPVIFLDTGLLPLLQMMVLPVLTYFIIRNMLKQD